MTKMKDSGIVWIGQIPDDWNIWPTKRFFRHTKTLAGEQVDSYERLALTMNGVIKRSKDDSEGLQPERFDTYQVLRENELVFKLIDLANVKTSRVGLSPYTGIVSPAYIVLSNDNKDNRFYYYYFMSIYYNEIFNNLGDNGVRSSLNAQELLNIPMVDIPQALQQRIADFLDDKCSKIDRYIEKQQQIIEKLKAYKQSVITESIITDEKVMPLRHCINNIEQGWSPPAADRVDESAGWNVLSLSAVKHGLFHYEAKKPIDIGADIPHSLELHNNDFLMTRSNTRELVGDVCIVKNCPSNLIFSDLIYRISFKNEISVEYMRYVMLSSYVRQQIQEMARGSSGTMPKISHKSIKEIRVPLLSKEQQCKVVQYLDKVCFKIDNAILQKETIIDKLTQYKKSLIYEAVTGKLEV